MAGIQPVSLPGAFAARLDPQSISPRPGAALPSRLPAPRSELVQERGQPTALTARHITTGTAATGRSGTAMRAAAQGLDAHAAGPFADHARPSHEVAPPAARGAQPPSAAQRRSANAELLSAVLSHPGTPPSAGLGILLRMADHMASQDAALLSTGTGALARRLAGEPASQRQACLASVAAAHQQGQVGEAAYGVFMTQLGT